ncbi:uncharacterized protein BDR25DRAFT_375589 [Lindgomyces ingoldianus]|uniref:Uncharacterized protein n=1 Tax=Lindgomyces ingoldianus TaxID=673940 RepID=A0ACB6RBB2_9PLEO|nr:uncharacterized protein BDR25DRAFT_375589 [Lindgomyces ingoldianus]KAF2476599.1 hypothetical protein BDR25DRAFT_375589 [Lindgomyces ingoldianus]
MKKDCLPPKKAVLKVATEFVSLTGVGRSQPILGLPKQVQNEMDDRFFASFAAFIRRTQFTRRFPSVNSDLMLLVHTSHPLRHAAIAIGALNASREGAISVLRGRDSPSIIAFTYYRKAILSLKSILAEKDVAQREDVLWSTFLLGLFELLAESSGEGWAQHMFYGTSRILQLSGPAQHMSSLRQVLFEAFRILEANRAILYGVDTMLSEDAWVDFQRDLTSSREESWCPIETISSLIIQTSSFNKCFLDVAENIFRQQHLADASIRALGERGFKIQNLVHQWHDEALARMYSSDDTDIHFQLSLTYYHALLLFLSRNFTYYSYWDRMTAPLLSQYDIDSHIAAIIALAEQILDASVIPGVMLLFPLRLAGSHTKNSDQRRRIWKILDQVHWKGFIVSDRIKTDLQELWQYQGLEMWNLGPV